MRVLSIYLKLLLFLSIIFLTSDESFGRSVVEKKESYYSTVRQLRLGSNTPESVGTLLTLDSAGVIFNVCTWFLIDKNLAMTNSHCIPDVLKVNPHLDCGDFLQGKFSNGLGVGALARCGKVILSSDISGNIKKNNDYALIELSKKYLNLKAFVFSREGVQENDRVKIHTMNHSNLGQSINSKYLEHTCIIKSSDLFSRFSSREVSPVYGFKEKNKDRSYCNPIKGNSGAAVVNSRGQVIGLLHGEVKEYEKRPFGDFSTSHVAAITNFRCLNFNNTILDRNLPRNCADALEEKDYHDDMDKEFGVKADIEINLFRNALPLVFGYKEEESYFQNDIFLKYTPYCVVALDYWSAADIDKVLVEKNSGVINHTYTADTFSLQLRSLVGYDYYGNYKLEVETFNHMDTQYRVHGLENVDSDKMMKVEMISDGALLGEVYLPICEI